MAKIAVTLEQALRERAVSGVPGEARARTLAQGEGFQVDDVVCTSGPEDRPFEEQHAGASIAIVAAGTFQYRSRHGQELMAPGALMLGHAGHAFECGHEHGRGDLCIAFRYAPGYMEQIAADAGARGGPSELRALRVPPLRALAPVVARACAALASEAEAPWEELGVELLARTVEVVRGIPPDSTPEPPAAVARVTRALRAIEREAAAGLSLSVLAREAGLSAYHFLRTFKRLTGLTPHQYVLRARLREAALRLATAREKVLDVAFDSGFGDVSNFNRAFRAEFGRSPLAFRRESAAPA